MSDFIGFLNGLVTFGLLIFFIFKFLPSIVNIGSNLLSILNTYSGVFQKKAKIDKSILAIKEQYNLIERLKMQEELLRTLIKTGCGDKVIQNCAKELNKIREVLGISLLTEDDLDKIVQEISNEK